VIHFFIDFNLMGIILFELVILLILLSNLWVLPRLDSYSALSPAACCVNFGSSPK
jgi:hypothetical protein